MRRAVEGLEELKKHLDTTIVVPNQNLFKIANETTTFEESFTLSNNVLKQGVQSITDLMVRPGMINLDFADVETVMSSMGKAMMGTGEAEGENRAMAATEMALNNPLIDEYSLKGAKGLLINITGGKDLTLFEVDQTAQKVRAEVDPEADVIFGAIKDDNMEGKMRVSIVATALDGHKRETSTVFNMVSRIQNRNQGYSEGLFSQSNNLENNPIGSIDGATALKLDEKYEISEEGFKSSINKIEPNNPEPRNENSFKIEEEAIPEGVSIESTSYLESNDNTTLPDEINNLNSDNDFVDSDQEHTPKLFSDDENLEREQMLDEEQDPNSDRLFEQDSNEEEDFEIPAFLRKQKF